MAEALGQSVEKLQRATGPAAPLKHLALVEGVVTRGAGGGASFGLKTRGQIGGRFLFCRALAEAISGHGDALVTKGDTERQQCNRSGVGPTRCIQRSSGARCYPVTRMLAGREMRAVALAATRVILTVPLRTPRIDATEPWTVTSMSRFGSV